MPHTLAHPILTQTFESSDLAFAKIDEEIQRLQQTLLALHNFRNSYTPIYRLPPEVLTRIFTLLRFRDTSNDDTTHFKGYRRHNHPPPWYVVAHVSRHWRDVALGNAMLWSHIELVEPRLATEEWLRRSKGLPLSVRYCGTSHQKIEFVKTALSRVKALHLQVPADTWNSLSKDLNSAAPLLESLSIHILNGVQTPTVISDGMFAHTAPRFKELRLIGCSVDPRSSFLKDLTVLEVDNLVQKLPAIEIFGVLRNSPCLRSIVLSDVLQVDAPLLGSNVNIVTLPSLESLSIQGKSFIQDLDILAHLSFRDTTSLRFYSDQDDPSVNASSESVLLNFLHVYREATKLTPTIAFNDDLKTHLSLNQCHVVNLQLNSESKTTAIKRSLVDFEVGVRSATLVVYEGSEVVSILSNLLRETLVSFTTNCDVHSGAWTTIFGPFPKLESITARGDHAIDLLEAIVVDFKAHGEELDTGTSTANPIAWTPIFLNLESIEINTMAFSSNKEDLLAAFAARKALGNGIKEFRITQCRGHVKSIIEPLGEIVDSVEWDGCQSKEEDPESSDGGDNLGEEYDYSDSDNELEDGY